jgi:hypothetical protein
VTVTVPVAAPLAAGEKLTFTVILLPASIVKGRDGTELSVNPVPEIATFETLTLLVVPFTKLNDAEVVPLTAMLPKSMLLGLAEIVPGLVPPPPEPEPLLVEVLAIPVPPAQPIIRIAANSAAARNHVLRIR